MFFKVLDTIDANLMKSSDSLPLAGFEEVDHTADWAYRVWGRDMRELFVEAAVALYAIAGVALTDADPVIRTVQLNGVDYESLLVAWLNELLYLNESEGLGFRQFDIQQLDAHHLQAQITGAPVQQWTKFIKAMTYHNLAIKPSDRGLEATLVMDV